MKIAYLDGKRLYRVLYAGIQSLLDEQDYLNKINVFPVPDGDTGTNMAFTLMGIIEHIQPHSQIALNELSQRVANAALDNARGNSGVIMAQFFQGLCQGLEAFSEVNTSQFAGASKIAVDEAYGALMNPVEGTILSVLRSWSDSLVEASKTSPDFQKVWKISLDAAQTALDRTPEQLQVLKDAGVVDAAGRGFLCILEGVMAFMDTGDIRQLPKIDTGFTSVALEMEDLSVSNLAFPFCTECIVVAEDIPRDILSKALKPHGDSIVIAGSKHRAKIHIHTDDPARLFDVAGQFGFVHQQKVDDMRDQNKSFRSEQEIALVVDSTCDLPLDIMEKHHIHVVPVRLNFGKEQYIDRVTITNEEFYAKLSESRVHPQTSQPPPADFKRMYQFLSSHYKSVLALHLPQVLSGTYQNSSAALEKIKFKGEQMILDTASVSAGTGIIALEVIEAIEAGKVFEEVINTANLAIQNTQIFIALKTLDAVQRGGRLSLGKKRLIELLRINLVLSINKDGYLKPCGATFGRKQLFEKFEKFVLKKAKGRSIKRIGIMHGVNPGTAEQLRITFSTKYPEATIIVADLCPALGVHGGVGAVGLALQYNSL
ncbi:MAG: DegV family EDD domain-containing protein [Candidatus Marinimicrobia bacterium]|nr:DegV family EDD domain-containing protein [Candidatus Neomarinimicrobiota bacterium]